MSSSKINLGGKKRRATLLAVIILVQAFCAIFFVWDVIHDFATSQNPDLLHAIVETVAAAILALGVVYAMIELRHLTDRMSTLETGLRVAQGQMVTIVDEFFEQWSLSPAERDVALMVLKGLDNEEIAALRGTAKGTVRAQCSGIYNKAGVEGRAQFISVFMEELLSGEGLTGNPRKA